jgi:phosphopantothenoylcysteine decarboxylase/phosphopantothenate--cysteine ligase
MLIAPATANTIAKIAHGEADNFLTTLVLALRCPLIIAPAMDVDMYLNETTRKNIALLRETGCTVLEADSGELASGLSGSGRMPEAVRLFDEVVKSLNNSRRDLAGKNVLVTAGPTHEPIDPVRFIGNRSSGKMGFAIAAAAAWRGANVTLISGPVSLSTPRNVRRLDVSTAREMNAAVMAEFPATDLLIMTAAVADFAPARSSQQKIKREQKPGGKFVLELLENPDILEAAGAKKTGQMIIGFALETENGVENARKKLASKNLDIVVLNNPLVEGAGFSTDTNVVTVITASGKVEEFPLMSKIDVANALLSRALKGLR